MTTHLRKRGHGKWYLGLLALLVVRIGTVFVDLRKITDGRQLADTFTSEDLLHPNNGVSVVEENEENPKWKQRDSGEAVQNHEENSNEAEGRDLDASEDEKNEGRTEVGNKEQRDPRISKNGDTSLKAKSEDADEERAKDAKTNPKGEHGGTSIKEAPAHEDDSNVGKMGDTKRDNDDPTILGEAADTVTKNTENKDGKERSGGTKPDSKGDTTTQKKGKDDDAKQDKQALAVHVNEVQQIHNSAEGKGEPSSDGQKEAQSAYKNLDKSSNKNKDMAHETVAFDVTQDQITQTLEGEASLLCSPWEINIDDFWQNHPDWEPSLENATHTCFSPIKDPEKAAFLQKLHKQQFPDNPKEACSKVAVSWFQDFGLGSLYMIIYPNDFFAYYHLGRPFTITNPNPAFRFAYVPSLQQSTEENSWAACPSKDAFCYFLPISSCEVAPGTPHAPTAKQRPKKKLRIMWDKKNLESAALQQQHQWMSEYLMRPRQETRKHLYELVQNEAPQLPSAPDCAWIHVRRGDAQTELEWGFFRNFYPIELYLKNGKIKPQDGDVLILTDDEAAIEEALLLHPEYQWKFFNKTRNRGVQRMFSHFPTKDPALEMLTILAEMKVASQCKKGVFGESKYPKLIEMAMSKRHRQEDMTKVKMDGGIRRKTEDAHKFMEELEAKLEKARNARKQKQIK